MSERADLMRRFSVIESTLDTHQADGPSGIVQPARHPPPANCVPIRATDVINLAAPEEIVEGIAWEGCITALVSESGTGKTFVLLDIAAAVSAEVPWKGRATRGGSVVYLGFEGDAIGQRLRALRDVSGYALEHVYVIRAVDPLSPRTSREGEERSMGELALIASLRYLVDDLEFQGAPPVRLLEIDTARASMSGSEDSSEHVAAWLRAARRIMAACPGAALIIAHHSGWQDGEQQRKRERGSSAWRGNCDATVYLEAGEYDRNRGEAPVTLRTLKTRDAERAEPLHLLRRRVQLTERDRRGEFRTSCVIERDPRSHEDRESAARVETEREHRELDLKALRTIATQPEMATSLERIRVALGTRKALVSESVARLVQAGWLLPGRQRQPYVVTEAGWEALNAASV